MNRIEKLRKEIKELEQEIDRVKQVASRKLELIEKGASFGHDDSWDFFAYHPLTLLEVVDRETYSIKVQEKGGAGQPISIVDVYFLYVEGY